MGDALVIIPWAACVIYLMWKSKDVREEDLPPSLRRK